MKKITNNSEAYRMRKMAELVYDCYTIVDIGYVDNPNIYFNNPVVIGADLAITDKNVCYDQVYQSDLPGLINILGSESVDAVVAGEIIEHIENPMAFLRDAFELVKPGGTLVLSTPNPHSIIESALTLWLSRKWFYTDQHIMLFPQRWLIRMVERTGFVDVKLYSGGFPVPYIGLIPFPRPWCYQTILYAKKKW